MTKQQKFVEPEQFSFKDDGVFPNSVLPLYCIGKCSQQSQGMGPRCLNNVLLRTTGATRGETAFIRSRIITAPLTRFLEFIAALRPCASAANTARTSKCMPGTL